MPRGLFILDWQSMSKHRGPQFTDFYVQDDNAIWFSWVSHRALGDIALCDRAGAATAVPLFQPTRPGTEGFRAHSIAQQRREAGRAIHLAPGK